MEISVENSGGGNTKSLDLKTLYSSEVSDKEGSVSKGKSSWLGNGEGVDTNKRKNRKGVAITGFEDLTERKKIKHIIDDNGFDGADTFSARTSGLSQKLNGDSGFNAVGINISGDGHTVLIPKRPRGSVGRIKSAKSHLLKPPVASGSVEKVASLSDELNDVLQNEVSSRGDPLDHNASSIEQIAQLNGQSGVKSSTNQEEDVDSEGNDKQEVAAVTSALDGGDLVNPIGSLGTEDQVAKLKDDVEKIPPSKVPDAAEAPLSGSSLGSEDQVAELKNEIKEIPQNNDVSVSSSTSADQMGKLKGNSTDKLRNNVRKEGIDGLDGNQKRKEDSAVDGSSHLAKGEGADLVLIQKDSASKRNGSNRRKRRMLGSGSETVAIKIESSVAKEVGTPYLDPDDDLEQNAARMLSSRFDPSCTGFASKNRTLALSSVNGESLLEKPTADIDSEGQMAASDPASAEAADRVLRPRRHQKGKGTSRKRRHFYEIHSDDMDAHWFLNRKIKIFWPLDESWYYGLVNDYDAEKNLHHIKYDDRDEEWISLENERFKLLLLPSEVPHKPNGKDTPSEDTHKEDDNGGNGNQPVPVYSNDEAFMSTHMESEPIISWLARSSQRVKSSALSFKKQKKAHFSSDTSLDACNRGNMGLLERETDNPNCSSAVLNTSREKNEQDKTNRSEEHLPIVYVRRRYRRFSDATNTSLIEYKRFEICISLWPMIKYVLGADIFWLLRGVFLLQYGTVVSMWPTVFLEVLFVDNIVGLRLFLFEGCLKQAVAFIFLVMEVFCEPEKDESIHLQIPVTSIRLKLSFFENFRKQKVFTYYSFSKLRDFNWRYLDSEFQPHCLLSKKLSLSECTYDNIKLLEAGTQQSHISYAGQTASYEVSSKKLNPGGFPLLSKSRSSKPAPGSRPSTIYSLKHGNLPPFALSFTAAPNFFLSLHLKLLLERSISLQNHADDCNHINSQFEISSESSSKSHEAISSLEPAGSHHSEDAVMVTVDGGPRKSSKRVPDACFKVDETSVCSNTDHTVEFRNDAEGSSNLKGISVEIPTSDEVCRDIQRIPGAQQVSDLTWNLSDGIICSPNPTGPRSLWHGNKSLAFGDPLSSWADGKTDFIGNGFGNGPKKPRTQVQYTLPSREFGLKNKGGHNQIGLPYQRIRKANDKKTSDTFKGPRRNLELVACDANILINGGDKGWREYGARVFLEASDQNEWKLAVKCSGDLKYAYKVHQDLQPGSTNRYTHAMMWKGGKDWALEFPDRSQWFLFKEMHEECHNRNIRAASIKNIPIPGVRMIEDSVNDQDFTPFTHNSWYFRQVRDDVEMAMDSSHVMYDMDSEDEEWVCECRATSCGSGEDDMISDELFEKIMDMLEKVSYAQKRDHFTSGEIDELIARVSPKQVAKSIYTHWREKRQRKGMPLIRQLQPPLWERYQQICKEWDQSKPKSTTGLVTGSQEKASAGDKPPMFAFCLKPRGLELLNKGSKHRPHKKISLSGHSHAFLGDQDTHPHSSGRRVNTYGFGDERAESSDISPLLTKMYSPRDSPSGPAHFSLDGDASDWNHHLKMQRSYNSKSSIRAVVSPKVAAMGPSSSFRKLGKRSHEGKRLNNALGFGDWHHNQQPYRHNQLVLGGSDLDEFRLRDASSAAKHARNMAKLKRERAQKLMLSADLAIHKAVSALMTAEAIKASCTEDDERMMKSTSPPSTS